MCLTLDPVNQFWCVRPFFHSKLNLQEDCRSKFPEIPDVSEKSGSRKQKNQLFSRGPGFFSVGHTSWVNQYGGLTFVSCRFFCTYNQILRIFQKTCATHFSRSATRNFLFVAFFLNFTVDTSDNKRYEMLLEVTWTAKLSGQGINKNSVHHLPTSILT